MNNPHLPKRSLERSGLSLIDLTITMFIIGITAAIATPRFSGALNQARLEAAAQRIEADIKYARNQAIARSLQTIINFQATPAQYEILNVLHPDHKSGDYVVSLSELSSAINLTVDFNGSATLRFNSYGFPSGGFPNNALTTGTITITLGNLSKVMQFNPSTGQVE